MPGYDSDGPEVARFATEAAEKIRQLVKEGKSMDQAEAGAESYLMEREVPLSLVGIALAEAMAMGRSLGELAPVTLAEAYR